jgi:hypothetical protein
MTRGCNGVMHTFIERIDQAPQSRACHYDADNATQSVIATSTAA